MSDLTLWTLGWVLLHATWIGALGVPVVLLARRCRRPELRYGLGLLSLALLAASVPVAWAFVTTAPVESSAPAAALPALGTGPGPVQASIGVVAEPLPQAVGVTRPAAANVAAPIEWLPPLRAALAWAWIAGAGLCAAWLALAALAVRRLRRQVTPLTAGPAVESARRVTRMLGLRREHALAVSDAVHSPLVLGVLRPVVVLPAESIDTWSAVELDQVLVHELSHVRRHDNLVNLGQRLLEVLLVFQPLVWWVSRWLRHERELCCDAQVVRLLGDARLYARTLLSLATVPATHSRVSVAMSASPLVDRIAHVLEEEPRMSSIPRLLAAPAVALTLLSVAALDARAQDPAPFRTRLPAQEAPAAPQLPQVGGLFSAPSSAPAVDPHALGLDFLGGVSHHGLILSPSTDCTSCHQVDVAPFVEHPAIERNASCTSCHVVGSAVAPEAAPGLFQGQAHGQAPWWGGHAPVPAPGQSQVAHRYTVKAGDTLRRIALEQLGDSQQAALLLRLNPQITNERMLRIGQELVLPGPVSTPPVDRFFGTSVPLPSGRSPEAAAPHTTRPAWPGLDAARPSPAPARLPATATAPGARPAMAPVTAPVTAPVMTPVMTPGQSPAWPFDPPRAARAPNWRGADPARPAQAPGWPLLTREAPAGSAPFSTPTSTPASTPANAPANAPASTPANAPTDADALQRRLDSLESTVDALRAELNQLRGQRETQPEEPLPTKAPSVF